MGSSRNGGALDRVSGLDVRRALLAVPLRERRPLTIAEIGDLLREGERVDIDWLVTRTHWLRPAPAGRQPSLAKRLSDLLGHQVAAGRVARVRPGVYQVDRAGMSASTVHRCLN